MREELDLSGGTLRDWIVGFFRAQGLAIVGLTQSLLNQKPLALTPLTPPPPPPKPYASIQLEGSQSLGFRVYGLGFYKYAGLSGFWFAFRACQGFRVDQGSQKVWGLERLNLRVIGFRNEGLSQTGVRSAQEGTATYLQHSSS